MHHRPVHLGELKALDDKKKKVNSLIASAKTHLSDEEKHDIATLKKQARDIFAQLVYERQNKTLMADCMAVKTITKQNYYSKPEQ